MPDLLWDASPFAAYSEEDAYLDEFDNQSSVEQFYLLRNNLVMDVARVLDIYTYSLGFEKARLSYATAVGLFKSVVSVALLVTANTVSNKVTGESIY